MSTAIAIKNTGPKVAPKDMVWTNANKKGYGSKLVKPQFAPAEDQTFLDFYYIEQNDYKYWWYKNKKGERRVLVVRVPLEDDNRKKIFKQGSYASGKYWKENVWTKLPDFKFDLFRLDELPDDKSIPIILNEGEGKTMKAQERFPDYFCTCYLGGGGNYDKTDYLPLLGRTVILWPDVQESGYGVEKFQELSNHLFTEYKIKALTVPVPSWKDLLVSFQGNFEKNSFDLEDDPPKDMDLRQLLESAEFIPEEEAEHKPRPFSKIENYLDKFIYIRNLGDRFFDKDKKRICSKVEVDNLFKRARGHEDSTYRRGSGADWFQENDCQIADGTTFYPSTKSIIKTEAGDMINFYVPPRIKSIGHDPDIENKVKWFLDHLRYTASDQEYAYKILVHTIAYAVQYPERQRNWLLLISGGQGTGKGIVTTVISKLVGKSNCVFLRLSQLYGRFNSFLINHNNIFVREANSKGKEDNETISILKDLTTEDTHEIELKGKDFLTHECHYNLYFTSNERQPFKVEKDDRRVGYILTEFPKRDKEYYKDIFDNKINNPDRIAELNYYFKHVVKIPDDPKVFDPNEAPWTEWKALLIEESKTGYIADLDRLREEKALPCMRYNLILPETVLIELRHFIQNDNRAKEYGFVFAPTKKQIINWINSISGSFHYRETYDPETKKKKSYAIQPKGQRRGHYYCIDDFEHWRKNRDNLDLVHEHFADYPKGEAQKVNTYEEYVQEQQGVQDDIPF